VRIILLSILIACAAGTARAQSPESKSSLSAVVGGGQTWDDEGSLGRGLLAGAAIDRALAGGLRAELSVELLTHDRSEGFLQAEGHTVILGASVLQRFGRGHAQPYLLGGVTTGWHSGSRTFVDRRSDESSSDVGWRAGLGLAIRAGSAFEISPEVRMNGFFIDSDSHPAMLLSAGVRFAMRL
jgi:hypothetical protein